MTRKKPYWTAERIDRANEAEKRIGEQDAKMIEEIFLRGSGELPEDQDK